MNGASIFHCVLWPRILSIPFHKSFINKSLSDLIIITIMMIMISTSFFIVKKNGEEKKLGTSHQHHIFALI